MARNIQNVIDFEGIASLSSLPRALSKDAVALPDLPTAFELNELNRGVPSLGPSVPHTPVGAETPLMLDELESRSSSPVYGRPVEALQTMSSPGINKYRVFAACLMNLANGLNDSAPGALIPYLEKEYRIGYAIVSLIFITNAVGFLSAAPWTHAIESRFGRARSYVLAECFLVVAYIMLVCRPVFPVIVLSFFFIGFGIATNLALNNVFCANLAEGTSEYILIILFVTKCRPRSIVP